MECPNICWTPFWTPFWVKPVLKFFLDSPRADQEYFFRPRRPPRALQEAKKKPLAGITHRTSNLKPFCLDFDLQRVTPGPQKTRKSAVLSSKIKVSTFLARVASWGRFWTLLGSFLGAFWPPRRLKPVLEFFLERPRAEREHFFSAPEASKSLPSGFQEASRLPRQFQELSQRPQDQF